MKRKIYNKLLEWKEVSKGTSALMVENVVAQMLVAAGHKLFFYSKSNNKDAEDRMEIDFLVRKSKITNRHNISPIEVKSGDWYSLTSLEKCIRKYGPYLSTPFVLHDGDVKEENDIVYLPLYMASLL